MIYAARTSNRIDGPSIGDRGRRVGLALVICGLLGSGTAAAAPPYSLLVVHSYHHGFEWTDRVHRGLLDALEPLPVETRVEYLDTKRLPDLAHLDAAAALLAQKYRSVPFDAIAAIDDNAIDFVIRHRAIFGASTPVVFGGYNAYQPRGLAEVPRLTGVAETVDVEGTLTLARRLVPGARTALVVSDATRTSSVVATRIRRYLATADEPLQFRFLTAARLEDAGRALAELPPDAIAILLPFTRGIGGRFIEYRQSARNLVPQSTVPVFSLWDFYLGEGIVGGSLTSGRLMGETTGRQLRRVLESEPVEQIPVIEVSPTVKQVDYRALMRHGIPVSRVPFGVEIVGAPSRTVAVDRRVLVWTAIGAIAVLILVVYLTNNVIRRRRAETELRAHQRQVERALAHETLLAEVASSLNATDDFKTVLDDILAKLTLNLAVAKVSLYSFSEEQAVGAKISSRLSERGKNIRDLDVLSFRPVQSVFDKLRQNERVIASALAELRPEEQEFYRNRNIGAIVILPLQIAGRVRGILGFSQESDYRWTEDELAVFATIAGLIAAAWERYGEMKARIEAEEKHADALQALEKSSRMAAVGVMAAGIAHEINQPLSAIRVTTEAALRRTTRATPAGPDWLTTKLRTVSAAVNRIDQIVRHVREFWTDRDHRNLAVLDVKASIHRAFELVGRQARHRGIDVVFDMTEAPILVRANPVQMEQIVINLVVNAVQAISEKRSTTEEDRGRIIVSASPSNGIASLRIADNGPGVAEDDVDRLFDPFFSTKRSFGGSGLGLAIARNLVESFQGKIEYQRNDTGGATFLLSFPLYDKGRDAA